MFFGLTLFLIAGVAADPVATAMENYKSVDSYAVTLVSRSGGSEEVIRYSYRKPGLVRMDFISPHKGAALAYDPGKETVVLRPLGFLKSFVLTLKADNRLIRSSRGHTVDKSDIGALFENVERIRQRGSVKVIAEESVGQRPSLKVGIEAVEGFTSDGVGRYVLWLEKKTLMPLKVLAYGADGEVYEEVVMDDLELNVEFPEGFFELR